MSTVKATAFVQRSTKSDIYHVKLFPHGAPVSQGHSYLCNDRVLGGNDGLKLPAGQDTQTHNHTHTSERVQDGEQWPHMTLWSNTDSWWRVCKYTCDGLWDNEGSCHINRADVSFCKCILTEAQGWSLVAVQCFIKGTGGRSKVRFH